MSASLVEQTYDALMQMIVNLEYRPGDRLPSENALCEELDVSRNTLRAALNKLSALGFTESRQGGGTYLRAVHPEDFLDMFIPATLSGEMNIIDILQFKSGIESQAAALAAVNATDEDIARMNECIAQCSHENMQGETGALSAGNVSFHNAVVQATHNALYTRISEILNLMLTALGEEHQADGSDVDGTFYHGMVVRSIQNHKPEEASFFMQRHMALIIEHVAERQAGSAANAAATTAN